MVIYFTDKVGDTYLDLDTDLEYTVSKGIIFVSMNAGEHLCYSLCSLKDCELVNRKEQV